jgi:hypothetical protein
MCYWFSGTEIIKQTVPTDYVLLKNENELLRNNLKDKERVITLLENQIKRDQEKVNAEIVKLNSASKKERGIAAKSPTGTPTPLTK